MDRSTGSVQACLCCERDKVTCTNPVDMPCGDRFYCEDCFRQVLELAIETEAQYPIRCHLPTCPGPSVDQVEAALNTDNSNDRSLLDRYLEMAEEYATQIDRRVYCSNQHCTVVQGKARFLNPKILGDHKRIICPDCDAITCIDCKSRTYPGEEHRCLTDEERDSSVLTHIKSLPEDARWCWQQCYRCRSWIEKTRDCNHMTCLCGAQFCLLCGKKWEGLSLCVHGCPLYNRAVYDDEGYNQNGFHRDTGLNREGIRRANDAQPGDDEDGHLYDNEGFDQWGYDIDGYGRDGFNHWGVNREGRDRDGFDDRGYDLEGFDRAGMSMNGRPRHAYREDGYDENGFDAFGLDREGYNTSGRDKDGFDRQGWGADGYNRYGFSAQGIGRHGFNMHGFDHEGYNGHGYNSQHRNRAGQLEVGYGVGSDGNARLLHTGASPSMSSLLCAHRTRFSRGGGTCMICGWDMYDFIMDCTQCPGQLCRDCSGMANHQQQRLAMSTHRWLEGESFGLETLFREVADDVDG